MRNLLFYTAIFFLATTISCHNQSDDFDATGNFEADETLVGAEGFGKIVSLNIEEGAVLKAGQQVGLIDTTQLFLKKIQLQRSITAVLSKRPDIDAQLSILKVQLQVAKRERERVANLLKAEAATQKQLDDFDGQIDVLNNQYKALQSSLRITTQSLRDESLTLESQLEQIKDQISKSIIINPIDGTVLTQYARQGEVTANGKALYKIADLKTITLRVYISGSQLSEIKLGQSVQIFVDGNEESNKKYTGTVTWISDKAEFTPKTIQTKEERANLVYALKILINNDGYLKLGMSGDVKF